MITLILLKKIVSFLIIMIGGFALVKLGVVKSSDSKILSLVFLYLIMPCAILNSFQIDYTPEISKGLCFSFAIAILIHIIFIGGNRILRKPLHLSVTEQTSIIYPACGNLTIPLVAAVLGDEWVIYASAFMTIQIILLWTHAKSLISGDSHFEFKKIITNINIIAIVIGILLFITHIRFPGPADDAVSTLSDMMGPVTMLVTGMLIADADIKSMLKNGRLWFVTILRLIAVPVILMLVLKYSGLALLVENGKTLLMITLMGIITPPAATITQMTQVYGGSDREAEYAGAINVMTNIMCMITMPLIIWFYNM